MFVIFICKKMRQPHRKVQEYNTTIVVICLQSFKQLGKVFIGCPMRIKVEHSCGMAALWNEVSHSEFLIADAVKTNGIQFVRAEDVLEPFSVSP